MADMGILANFRQAGAAGQGAWRLYYMGKANQRAEEQHQQQAEMNEMKMQQEQQKMQRQQEMEKLKEDWVNAQTPEEKKAAYDRLQIQDPKYTTQVQQSIGKANKNQIDQYDASVKAKLPYFAVIDKLDKEGKNNQAEAAFGAMKKNLSEMPGVDMKSVPNTFYGPTGAKQSGWFDIESAKGRYTSDAIKSRMKELEFLEKRRVNNYKIENYKSQITTRSERTDLLKKNSASGGNKLTALQRNSMWLAKQLGISEAEAFKELNKPKESPGKMMQGLISKHTAFNGSPPSKKQMEKYKETVDTWAKLYYRSGKNSGYSEFKLKQSYKSNKELGMHLEDAVEKKIISEDEAKRLFQKHKKK